MLKTSFLSISIEYLFDFGLFFRFSAFNSILAATTNKIAKGSKTNLDNYSGCLPFLPPFFAGGSGAFGSNLELITGI